MDNLGTPRMRAPCRLLPAALICALLLVAAPAVRADGDPASDVLLLQNVYLPYQPAVSPSLGHAITTLLSESAKRGYPLKVAIIASPDDLGAVPNMFGQPQRYAHFLASEIAFNGHHPLLVVMPAGYGLDGVGAGGTSALAGLGAPSVGGSDTLARAAIEAVLRLSKAAGHPLPPPQYSTAAGSSPGGGAPPALVFGLPVAVLLLAGGALTLRRRAHRLEAELEEEEAAAATRPSD